MQSGPHPIEIPPEEACVPHRVLIIEDDPELGELVALHLREAGYSTQVERDGRTGLEQALRRRQDLIILDLMLPGGPDGLEICRTLRARQEYVPILMLTARDTELDRVLGLELGADDYLTKPFSVRELVARVKAIFRRIDVLASESGSLSQTPIKVGALRIDPLGREVQIEKRRIDLTGREFDLLLEFARHPGRVFSRAELLDRVWGYRHSGYEHTVNSHINRLRAKIERDPASPSYILTVWGVGYKLRSAADEAGA